MIDDFEIQQLEMMLDGELSPADEQALRAWMATHPSLASACQRLIAQRESRQDYFKSLEGNANYGRGMLHRVLQQSAIQHSKRSTWIRQAAYAAACLVLGIGIGMVYARSHQPPGSPGVLAKSSPPEPAKPAGAAPAYIVQLKDETGKVIAAQKFDSARKAADFSGDLLRLQEKQARHEPVDSLMSSQL
jgi:anti-sigma factor RsiW